MSDYFQAIVGVSVWSEETLLAANLSILLNEPLGFSTMNRSVHHKVSLSQRFEDPTGPSLRVGVVVVVLDAPAY